MWFRRKKKPDQDSVLNEALRSLQGILEESDTDEMPGPDGRREPSLRSGAQAESTAAADETTPPAAAQEDDGEQSPETTWHNLSLSFDVEPRARPEPEAPAEQQSSAEAAEGSTAADEDGALEIQETREAVDSSAEEHAEDDDLEIVIDSPAPGYARDEDAEDESSAVKFGSSVVEITLDIDDFDDDAIASGDDADSGTAAPTAEAVMPASSEGPPPPGADAGTAVAETEAEPSRPAGLSPRTSVIDEEGAGDTGYYDQPVPGEETEPEITADVSAASRPAPTEVPGVVDGGDTAPAEAEEAAAALPPADVQGRVEPPAAEETAGADVAAAAAPAMGIGQAEDEGDNRLAGDEESLEQIAADEPGETRPGEETDDATNQAPAVEALAPAHAPAADGSVPEVGNEGVEADADGQQPGPERAGIDLATDRSLAEGSLTPVYAPTAHEAAEATTSAEPATGGDSQDAAAIEPAGSQAADEAAVAGSDAQQPSAETAAVDLPASTISSGEPLSEPAPAATGSDNGQEAGAIVEEAVARDDLPPPEPQDDTDDAIAAVAEAIRDAEALRMQKGDGPVSTATAEEADDSAPAPGDSHIPAPPPAQDNPLAAELDDDIPVLDDLVYVPEENTGAVDERPFDSPPPQADAVAAAIAAGPQSDPELRRLVQRVTQNLRLRLELGEGTPLDEEQESQLRDALFDTLAQWKEQGDL